MDCELNYIFKTPQREKKIKRRKLNEKHINNWTEFSVLRYVDIRSQMDHRFKK